VLKYAALEMLDAWRQPTAGGISRLAHRVAFHYDPRPGYLYVRSRMISSRTNDNHDTFPAGEIEKGYTTFLGKPVFVNHNNANHRRARGVIVAVALHRDRTRDGSPDTWVEGLMEVDAVRFPKLAKAILEGRVNRTSMGVDVDWSTCSACGNKATSPAEYCKHLPAMKGRKIRQRNAKTGKVEERLIHEICAGLSFFENSLLVEDPADPSAFLLGEPDTRGLHMSPRSASSNPGDRRARNAVTPGDVQEAELASLRTSVAGRYQGQKFVFDDPDVGVGEFDSRVAYARQAAPLGHHVGRVDRVGAQEPVHGVHADLEVARVADDKARRNRPSQQLPAIAMRADARPSRVRQREARVPAVEGSARPRVAEARPCAEIDQREVPVNLRHRSYESSVQFTPADHGVNHSREPDARGMEKAAGLRPAQARPAQARRPFGELAPHEQQAVALYHRQMLEEGNAPQGSTTGDYLYEPRQEPRGDFINRYMDADDEFKREYGRGAADWEAHHQDTVARHPIPAYPPEGRWPLIVSDANPNYIDDGYHRMHSYMRDGATEIPTIRMHPKRASKTAAAGDPDFRDLIPNSCTQCGKPVHYRPGAGRNGTYPWRHRHQAIEDHAAVPSNPDDRRPSQNATFGGTTCLMCHEPVKINLNALDTDTGGWHHHDGMKRDHPAIPKDARAVYDAIPGIRAQHDQARQQIREHLHRQFEQMEGRPLPRRPRGDEDRMPPDPFTARRKRARRQAAGRFREEFTHCSNCGVPLLDADDISAADSPGDWSHHGYPHLCMNCAIGPISDEGTIPGTPGKPHPIFPGNKGGYHLRPGLAGDPMPTDRLPESYRNWEPGDAVRQSTSSRKTAYGETRVPPQVDTLRMDECPVCGEHNVWSGSRCPVCGFVVPPSVFRDPDTDKARQVRDQLDADGEVTEDPQDPQGQEMGEEEQIGSGDDADDQLTHPDQIAPDGVPVVQGEGGPVPGEEEGAQAGPPPEEEGEEQGEPGGIPGDAGEEGGPPVDQEEEPGDELECPACGTTFETDAYAQPGMPCPACGMANLHPIDESGEDGEFPPDDGDPDGEEEEGDGPQKDQEDDPSAPGDEKEEDEDMPAKTGAALMQAQARRIAEQSAMIEALSAQLRYLASAAGVGRELDEVGRRVMRRHADIMNPASPVPDPPEGPPSETTEQALMPEAMDDPSRPGATPGANSRVPAAQTTTAITPGVEMQTPPATNLVDVTAPVQGTNPSQDGGVPIEQRRIETDVRIDPDPLKAHGPGIGGQGDNGAAFPWMLDARMPDQGGQPGQGQRAASLHSQPGEAESSRRTFGAIRLARLRVQAGLAQGDELAVAERIERDASLSTAMIEHDISTLEQVGAVARPQAPLQRQAARSAPSLASVGAASQYAPAAADDLDGSDLFL
jgi:hypothetical protein